MEQFLKQYGTTEGPLGLPMNDSQARSLDQLIKALPAEDRELCRLVTAKASSEVLDGERADVSWISTESIDRDSEIVIARGMNDSHFKGNPLVTMNHAYACPPVGRSLWRKRARDGAIAGIKAKTQYPAKPDDWTQDVWPPDTAFQLVKAGLLTGKSVGFIRLKSHAPTSHEIAAKPEWATVTRIIDEWLLLEYACTFLPTNQDALVESVSKSGVKVPPDWLPKGVVLPPLKAPTIPFTTEVEWAAAIRRSFAGINPQTLIKTAVQDAFYAARGGV